MKVKILLLALAIPLALAAAIPAPQKRPALTLEDCALIFPQSNSCEKMRVLESGALFGEAWENALEGADAFLGYVFLAPMMHAGRTLDLIVGVNQSGIIQGVKVRGADDVTEEFLAQFKGRTAENDFRVAGTAEDLMYVPLKIKAMREDIPLSASIAQSVKDIAALAQVVLKK